MLPADVGRHPVLSHSCSAVPYVDADGKIRSPLLLFSSQALAPWGPVCACGLEAGVVDLAGGLFFSSPLRMLVSPSPAPGPRYSRAEDMVQKSRGRRVRRKEDRLPPSASEPLRQPGPAGMMSGEGQLLT